MLDRQRNHADAMAEDPQSINQSGQYSIDELATLSGVPTRTIRFYQSNGALPPPEKSGRKAFYGAFHLRCLKLIGELKDRGLQIRAIRTLISRLDSGKNSVEEWLGFSDQLRQPWSEDVPQLMSEDELREMVEGHRAGIIGSLMESGIVVQEASRYLIRSPALLRMALELEKQGVEVETARAAADVLIKHLSRAAQDLTRFFMENVEKKLVSNGDPEQVTALLAALRPVALDAARVIFAHEIERSIKKAFHEGKVG